MRKILHYRDAETFVMVGAENCIMVLVKRTEYIRMWWAWYILFYWGHRFAGGIVHYSGVIEHV